MINSSRTRTSDLLAGFRKGFLLASVGLLVFVSISAQAEEVDGEENATTSEEAWYDKSHTRISKVLDDSVGWFDEFFGDPRVETTAAADAFLRVTLDGFYSGVEGESDYRIRTSGYVKLPKLEGKARVVFSNDADRAISGEDAVDSDPRLQHNNNDDTDRALGLSYKFRDWPNHLFYLTGGVKASPAVFVKGKYRYTIPYSETTRLRLTNTLYWKSDDGAGVSSLADFEHNSDENTVWRYTLFGNYGDDTDGLEWSTGGTWLRRLNKKTAISARVGISGDSEASDLIKHGWTTFRYRRNFLRPWLFYEIEPGLSWHEKEDFNVEPTLGLRMEILL